MDEFVNVLKKYTEFAGRAPRREYWMFVLVYLLVLIVLSVLDHIAGLTFGRERTGVLTSIFVLGTLLPALAVGVRRLHDIGRSGWWLLINLVPLIGPVVMLVFTVLDSQPGANAYGPNPKGAEPAKAPGAV